MRKAINPRNNRKLVKHCAVILQKITDPQENTYIAQLLKVPRHGSILGLKIQTKENLK